MASPIHAAKGVTTPARLAPQKIHSIVVAPLSGESPKGGWSAEIKPADSVHALIAVHTQDGLTGYGSVFADGRLVQAAVDVLEPLFAGEDALQPERLTEKLHQNTFWMGRGGSLTHAISGIDIALWDILGQTVGLPISQLLGGSYRSRVQPYCSLLMEEPAKMRDTLALYSERDGYRAFKIGWGPFGRALDTRLDEAIIRVARDAVGEDSKLFVDAGACDAHWPHGLKWAMRTADMLAGYGVDWFEEPLRPDSIDDYCHLRRVSRVPIAGGEVLTRRQTFLPWLSRGAFDIVQPDVTKVGGLSEQRRIAWMADDFDVRYVGHGWNTGVGVAADLQMAAAFPHVDYVEFIGGSAYVDGILSEPFVIDAQGYLAIPDRPGLGVALDRDKIARYSPNAAALFSV